MSKSIKKLTKRQVEKLRLILSTYQDGTGMVSRKGGLTLPGWRDFERSIALVIGGEAQENKAIFDVLVPISKKSRNKFGLSCKMRSELNRIKKINKGDGRVTLEISNSARKFWDHLKTKKIDQTNYRKKPRAVGIALIELVHRWHDDVSTASNGNVDLSRSSYLVLSYNKDGQYQLHQFPIQLHDPKSLKWHFPTIDKNGKKTQAKRLRGYDATGTWFEWYGESGGQLKYYPPAENATWSSDVLTLEPLGNVKHGIIARVEEYFPEKWAKVNS